MRRLLLACLLLSSPVAMPAQWRIALIAGTASSRGDARDDADPDHPEIRAEAPAALAVSLAKERGAWRYGVEFHHTSADLAEISASSAVTTRNLLKSWGAAIESARRLAGRRDGAALLVSLGVGVDRWQFDLAESSPRWRPSARGALELDLPVARAWSVVVRGQATVGPSVFKLEELPEDFVRRTALRMGTGLGLARRL